MRARRWDATKPSLTWQRFMENKNRELDRLNSVYKKLLDGAKVQPEHPAAAATQPAAVSLPLLCATR